MPMPIRKIVVALVATSAVALSACAYTPTSGVEEGDGPATEQVETTTEETTTEETTDTTEGAETTSDEGETYEDETTEEEEPAEPAVASFTQKYTYEDGVEVEVTKIEHGKISSADAEMAEPEASKGDPYVMLTVRVKNGSTKKLDAFSSWTMTYGADGEEAVSPYLSSKSEDESEITGKILPGRSKVAVDTFVIPTKAQKGDNPPVLEFSFDMEHEAAIFTGPMA